VAPALHPVTLKEDFKIPRHQKTNSGH